MIVCASTQKITKMWERCGYIRLDVYVWYGGGGGAKVFHPPRTSRQDWRSPHGRVAVRQQTWDISDTATSDWAAHARARISTSVSHRPSQRALPTGSSSAFLDFVFFGVVFFFNLSFCSGSVSCWKIIKRSLIWDFVLLFNQLR